MRAKVFDLIRAAKDRDRDSWDKIADGINEKKGTNLTGTQVKEFVLRGKVPMGGWLVSAIQEHFGIRDFGPDFLKSFRNGGDDDL